MNTDAEGRLILADALALAAQAKARLHDQSGDPDRRLHGRFGHASRPECSATTKPSPTRSCAARQETGEKLWQLPLVKEYRGAIKSSVADMKNIGGAHGGAITAALILQEFVDDIPWAHLDIAGPAFAESDIALCPKGGTGFGVRTLLKFLSTLIRRQIMGKITEVGDNNFEAEVIKVGGAGAGRFLGALVRPVQIDRADRRRNRRRVRRQTQSHQTQRR